MTYNDFFDACIDKKNYKIKTSFNLKNMLKTISDGEEYILDEIEFKSAVNFKVERNRYLHIDLIFSEDDLDNLNIIYNTVSDFFTMYNEISEDSLKLPFTNITLLPDDLDNFILLCVDLQTYSLISYKINLPANVLRLTYEIESVFLIENDLMENINEEIEEIIENEVEVENKIEKEIIEEIIEENIIEHEISEKEEVVIENDIQEEGIEDIIISDEEDEDYDYNF